MKNPKNHFKKADPVLWRAVRCINLQPVTPRKDYFQSLVRAIANQQLSGKAAQTILNRMQALFKSAKFPTPKEYLKMPAARLRAAGFSAAKVSYTKNVARFFVEHAKEIKKIHTMTDEEVIGLLTSIRGIGVWSAEMFMMFSLGREDVFSFGDLGLRNGLKKIYRLKKEPTIKQMKKITEAWKPYRTHAARYLWALLGE